MNMCHINPYGNVKNGEHENKTNSHNIYLHISILQENVTPNIYKHLTYINNLYTKLYKKYHIINSQSILHWSNGNNKKI